MGCGSKLEDFASDTWDNVVETVVDIVDVVKDVVDDVIDITEKLTNEIIESVADVAKFANNIIEIPVLSDLVDDAINITEDTLLNVVEIAYDGVKILSDAAYYTVKGVAATLQDGNLLEIILTVAAAIATGGTSLIYQYAIPGFTKSLYMHGVISQEWATAINIGAQLYAVFYAVTNPSEIMNNMSTSFQALGASAATAMWLANSIATGMAIAGPAMQVYGMYESYNMVKDLQDMYATALAQFEAWKKAFEEQNAKRETEWQEGMGFADGSYYEKLPGQFMYGVFSPSREAYVPMDVPQAAYWVENTKSPYNVDKEVANIMWDVKDVEFRNKFDLIPYQLDTGSTVGNASIGKGVAYLEAVETYETAVSAQNTAIANKEIKIQETTTTISEKLSEIESSIIEAELDIKNLEISQKSYSMWKEKGKGNYYSMTTYDITKNTFGSTGAVYEGEYNSKISPVSRYNTKGIQTLKDSIKEYSTLKLTLAEQLKKLESM